MAYFLELIAAMARSAGNAYRLGRINRVGLTARRVKIGSWRSLSVRLEAKSMAYLSKPTVL